MHKMQAAEKEVEGLRAIFNSRGCKENLIPDPELLAEGKVCYICQPPDICKGLGISSILQKFIH